MCKGDIVLIKDTNAIRGSWKLGKVLKVYPSETDGKVKNVDVQYKNQIKKNLITIKRAKSCHNIAHRRR